MGTCRWCGKSGWFVSVNKQGLCSGCNTAITLEASQKVRIIQESKDIVMKSKKLDTKLSRLDLMLEVATDLLKYEDKGIEVIDPPPSEIIRMIQTDQQELVLAWAREQVDNILTKANLKPTPKTKINAGTKALEAVAEARQKLDGGHPDLENLEKKTKAFIHQTTLAGYLDAAQKAEFKGQKKKALDQYQEALYLLKTDDTDDALQADEIARIEVKIAELTQ